MNLGALRRHALPAGLTLAALATLCVPIWSSGVPRGADWWSHLFKAEFLAGQIHSRGLGAYFTSAWMPSWYLGDPFRTYYPPLTVLSLTPIQLLTGDVVVTAKVFAGAALLIYAALTYAFLNRQWGPWPAGLGSILALWAPYQLRTMFFEGNYPRVLAFLALPLIAWQTEQILTAPKNRGRAALALGLAWAWTILAHPQQAYMFAVGFAIYLAARLFLEPDVPLVRAAWWLGGLLWGAALTLPWTLPAYVGNELPGIPYLPEIKVETFVAGLSSILPGLSLLDGRILLGSGTILLALLAAIARPDPRRTGYVLAALLTFWFSVGSSSVGFALLPLHHQLLPERFLNFTAFALPVAAAGIVPFQRTARPARLFVAVSLLAIDAIPGLSILRPVPYPREQAALRDLGSTLNDGGGRVALLTYPEPTAPEVYFAGLGSDLLNGWALENTPHHVALRRVLGAPTWGVDYLAARFSLWDVRQVVIRGGVEAGPARRAVERIGFAPAGRLGPYEVWQDPTPSAPVQRLGGGRMLVVGEDLAPFIGAFPFAEELRTSDFSQLDLADLALHPALGLYRFESEPEELAAAEEDLRDYLARGGTLVVDLSGMEGMIGRSVDFLDVSVLRLSFDEPIELRWADELGAMPRRIALEGLPEPGWSGAAYFGLDAVLAEVEMDGEWYPILSYKDVEGGRAWFIGLNLLYYGQITADDQLVGMLRETVLETSAASRDLRLEGVPIRELEITDQGLSFIAGPAEAGDVVISYTYTPRWEVTVDGVSSSYSSYEGLIRLRLPSGEHRVEARYRPYGTAWPRLGLALGLLAVALAGGVIWAERRAGRLHEAPVKPQVEEPSYVPCAGCGFRLAEQSAPTAVTYPFNVVSCPICGLRMDDQGFVPGVSLGAAEREQRLTHWLESHNYAPEQVYYRWGFGVDDFFDPEAVARGSPPSETAAGSMDALQDPDR